MQRIQQRDGYFNNQLFQYWSFISNSLGTTTTPTASPSQASASEDEWQCTTVQLTRRNRPWCKGLKPCTINYSTGLSNSIVSASRIVLGVNVCKESNNMTDNTTEYFSLGLSRTTTQSAFSLWRTDAAPASASDASTAPTPVLRGTSRTRWLHAAWPSGSATRCWTSCLCTVPSRSFSYHYTVGLSTVAY